MQTRFIYALLAVVGLNSHCFAISAPADGWPQWLGPNHDGKSTDTGLLKQWPEQGPKLLWKIRTIGRGYGTPAIADGIVYVTGDDNARFCVYGITADGKPALKIDHGPVFSGDHPVLAERRLSVTEIFTSWAAPDFSGATTSRAARAAGPTT